MNEIIKWKYYKLVYKDTTPENKIILVCKWGPNLKKRGWYGGTLMAKVFTYITGVYYIENYAPFVSSVTLCLILLLWLKLIGN